MFSNLTVVLVVLKPIHTLFQRWQYSWPRRSPRTSDCSCTPFFGLKNRVRVPSPQRRCLCDPVRVVTTGAHLDPYVHICNSHSTEGMDVSLSPVCDGPGVEAANGLMSYQAEVGVMLLPVLLDAPQHATWHWHTRPPAPLHRAWEDEAAAAGLLLTSGALLRQAALRQNTVAGETDKRDAHTDERTERQTGGSWHRAFYYLEPLHSQCFNWAQGFLRRRRSCDNLFEVGARANTVTLLNKHPPLCSIWGSESYEIRRRSDAACPPTLLRLAQGESGLSWSLPWSGSIILCVDKSAWLSQQH